MSLIDDALKRAQEAGASGEARTAERPWTPTPLPDPGLARAARLRRILGVAGLAAMAAAGVYLFLRGPAPEGPAKAATAAAPTSPPEPSSAEPTPFPVVVVPTPPRAHRATAVASPQEVAAAPPPADVVASVPAPPPAAAPAPAPRPASPRTYAGSVALPGGAKIELGGIAWSETEPRALVNDRIVAVGGYVEGYEVSKIETDRIELQKDGATIIVTVK